MQQGWGSELLAWHDALPLESLQVFEPLPTVWACRTNATPNVATTVPIAVLPISFFSLSIGLLFFALGHGARLCWPWRLHPKPSFDRPVPSVNSELFFPAPYLLPPPSPGFNCLRVRIPVAGFIGNGGKSSNFTGSGNGHFYDPLCRSRATL